MAGLRCRSKRVDKGELPSGTTRDDLYSHIGIKRDGNERSFESIVKTADGRSYSLLLIAQSIQYLSVVVCNAYLLSRREYISVPGTDDG
jgi:hypothetical protein